VFERVRAWMDSRWRACCFGLCLCRLHTTHETLGSESVENRTIYITQFDMARLREQILQARRLTSGTLPSLAKLDAELNRATVVDATSVPPDVITMNSRVRLLDLDTGEEMVFTLVFPAEADITESKISVLAPIGTAMLGYRAGDTFTWEVPDGERTLQVKELLYQPEAAGDYHL
jgi:regulator of nucleoside diphosphate kinase